MNFDPNYKQNFVLLKGKSNEARYQISKTYLKGTMPILENISLRIVADEIIAHDYDGSTSPSFRNYVDTESKKVDAMLRIIYN